MSCSPPSAKQSKLSCPINSLADSDLEEIFKRLPLYERLIVSEVCRRWHSISRKSWFDIWKIDLTPIPGEHIAAIINQCPNLQSVVAVNKTFDSNELTCLAKVPSLKRVILFACDCNLTADKASIEQNIFSDSLENASWTEFIIQDARFLAPLTTPDARGVHLATTFLFSVANLPASLTHLQLSGLRLCEGRYYSKSGLSLDGLERLENLECFIFHWSPPYSRTLPVGYNNAAYDLAVPALMKANVLEKLIRLKNLKELCLGPVYLDAQWLADLLSGLPKLEVLFLMHVDGNDIAENLAKLFTTSNAVLRVLVLPGVFWVNEPIEIPARKRFPHRRQISHKSWLDITVLNVSPIPGKHIAAVIQQCPNLQSVVAVEKRFGLNELVGLSKRRSLSRAAFYGCEFTLPEFTSDVFSGIFSNHLEHATWTELIMHEADFSVHNEDPDDRKAPTPLLIFNAAALPASLKRLQLSGFRRSKGELSRTKHSLFNGLERLENLECLILHSTPDAYDICFDYDPFELVRGAVGVTAVFEAICRLKQLKELCLGPVEATFEKVALEKLLAELPKLDVLVLSGVNGDDIADDLKRLVTTASVLNILVLSGKFDAYEPIELPARRRFPRGFGSDPLPLLHVFVGKEASENIRFNKSASDAAVVHPINVPMPEFLQREDIAPIFEGVWVAKMIKETAKTGGRLWVYAADDVAKSIQFA